MAQQRITECRDSAALLASAARAWLDEHHVCEDEYSDPTTLAKPFVMAAESAFARVAEGGA